MRIWDKNKKSGETDVPVDPLGLEGVSAAGGETETAAGTGGRKPSLLQKRGRSRRERKVVRVEEIRRALEDAGEDVDTDAVVSLYLPQRRARRFGAAVLRLNRLHLLLLALLLALAALFILAFMQEKMGNFTINLNRLEMYRKGISFAADGDFTEATARLVAEAVVDATNISGSELPEDIDDIDGNHNGKNYMAYTYYIRNAGKEDVSYYARIRMDSCAK